MYAFELHGFFFYHLGLMSVILLVVGRMQEKQAFAIIMSASNTDDSKAFAKSTVLTKRYFAYSSFVYVIVFALSYLVILNVFFPPPR